MIHREIERLQRVFAALLGPLLGVSAGCGIDDEQFTVDVCADGSEYAILEHVVPAVGVDYLDLHRASEWGAPERVDVIGVACSGATDQEACLAALEELPTESALVTSRIDHLLLWMLTYTRGDEVGRILTGDDLWEFLGAIDGPGDAALQVLLGKAPSGHQLKCTEGNEVGPHPEGFVVRTRSGSGCGEGNDIEEHVVLVRSDGTTEILETERISRASPNCAVGRLPPGLCPRSRIAAQGTRGTSPRVPRPRSPVGDFFAEVAHLEAAAVPAFLQLAGELELHGAPRWMSQRSRRSAQEEVGHARKVGALARRYGGHPTPPRIRAQGPRSLALVASDNLVEGCLRETYGALVAHVQARRARDPVVRRVLAGIAAEETNHAGLSWSVARWAAATMTAPERRQVAAAGRRARERFASELTELTAPLDPEVHAVTGMPDPATARALYDGLWAALAPAL